MWLANIFVFATATPVYIYDCQIVKPAFLVRIVKTCGQVSTDVSERSTEKDTFKNHPSTGTYLNTFTQSTTLQDWLQVYIYYTKTYCVCSINN